MKTRFTIIVIILFLSISNLKAQAILNPSFEKGDNNKPSMWLFETWDKGITSEWSSISHTGNKSVAIINTVRGWAHWSIITPLRP